VRASAPNGLGDGLFGFFSGNGLAAGIHLGKIMLERIDDFLPPLIREGRGLECANADGLFL
jgi:hypothetical protein